MEYIRLLNDAMHDMINKSTHFLMSPEHKNINLIDTLSALQNKLKQHVKTLQGFINACANKKPSSKSEKYIYMSQGGILAYGKKSQKENAKEIKNTNTAYIKELNYKVRMKTVKSLSDIPPSLYWFDGDIKNPAGVYINISTNIYARVPLPQIIDSTSDSRRAKSIKCKHINLEACKASRREKAKLHHSQIRSCNFAHVGEKYTRIGYSSRCFSSPGFGNPSTFIQDLPKIKISDIKQILMGALSDLLVSSIWCESSKKNKILKNLDIC